MRFFYAVVIVGLLIGCGGGKGKGGSASTPKQLSNKIEVTIGSQGGKIADTNPASPLYGVSIDAPSGAVSSATIFTAEKIQTSGDIAGETAIRFGPPGIFARDVTIGIPYTDEHTQKYEVDPQDYYLFVESANGTTEVVQPKNIDVVQLRITGEVGHFSTIRPFDPQTYILMGESYKLLDSTPVSVTVLMPPTFGGSFPVLADGQLQTTIVIGKGTLTNFWKAGQRNLIVFPGITASPLTFYYDDKGKENRNDFSWLFRNDPAFDDYDNVIYFKYPSGYPIEKISSWFASTVRSNAQTGCKFDILPHSLGCLVARHAIEVEGISQYVDHVFFLAGPHEGGELHRFITYFARWRIGNLIAKGLLPSGEEALIGSTFLMNLNTNFPGKKLPSTRYHLVATQNDEIVGIGSATSPILGVAQTDILILINDSHWGVHGNAKTNGSAVWIREKSSGKKNKIPVANAGQDQTVTLPSQGAPQVTVTLVGSATDADPGETLTYAWRQIGGPAVTLANATSTTPNFTPTQTGVYEFEYTASDSLDTGADTVTITVNPPPFYTATVVLTDDTYIESTYTKQLNNYGGLTTLLAGPTGSNSIWTYQTFLRFEVQSAIPAGATILSATLTCGNSSADCYKTGTGWSEYYLTWDSLYGTAFQGVPGTYIGTLTNGTFDATAYFQTQVANGIAPKTAFSFAFDRPYGSGAVYFASKESTSSTPPILTIKWK